MMQFLKDRAIGSVMAALLACGMATPAAAEPDVAAQAPAARNAVEQAPAPAQNAGEQAPAPAPAENGAERKSAGQPLTQERNGANQTPDKAPRAVSVRHQGLLPLQEGLLPRAVDPESVVLWPGGARVSAREELALEKTPGGATASFVVPAGARDLEISVEGARLLRWTSVPCLLPAQGGLAHERQNAIDNLRALRGEQAALRAMLDAWTTRPLQAGIDPEQFSGRLEKRVPDLYARLAQVNEFIAALEKVEKSRPALSDRGQKIELQLLEATGPVTARYRYTLPDCGWQPRYVFNAVPDESGKTAAVQVRLEASVRQFSGMDWRNSRLFLALRPNDAVAPPPLPRWIVDDVPQARGKVMAMAANAPMARAVPAAAAEADALVSLNQDGQDARWEVAAPGLPQGESVAVLREDVWTASLERVARPGEGDGRVWLAAEVSLPAGAVWPAGAASFQLEGIPTGERDFVVEDGKARLFFGVDPRVTIEVKADGQRRGEAGIVNRRRQWRWAWEYTVLNGRSAPVQVRLERPRPHIVERGVNMALDDAPKAEVDESRNSLFWLVDVPAEGKAQVRHGLTITAPADSKIRPVAP